MAHRSAAAAFGRRLTTAVARPLRTEATGATATASASAPVHRVVSWNILAHEHTHWNTHDKANESDAFRQWRWRAIDSAIRHALRPDILCVQEITPAFMAQSAALNDTARFDVVSAQRTGQPDGSAIAVDRSKYERIAVDVCRFRSAYKPRLALTALYRSRRPDPAAPDADAYLAVANAHLEGTPDAGGVRIAQAVEAVNHAQALVRGAKLPASARVGLVLCGDFNEPNIADLRDALARAPYGLQWLGPKHVTCHKNTAIDHAFASRNLFPLHRAAGTGAVDSAGDGVSVYPDPVPRSGEGLKVPYGKAGSAAGSGVWPSDHGALIAELLLLDR